MIKQGSIVEAPVGTNGPYTIAYKPALPFAAVTLWVTPGAGGSMSVEYSLDGGATYTAWTPGTVTAHAEQILSADLGQIKVTATTAAGTWGVA